MAVEIPVFVDVEKAFRDAANRVQAAIKPMQQAIDNSVLEVKVGTGSGKRSTIQNIVDNIGKYSTAQLEKAIQSIDRQLTTLYKKSNGALDFSSGKAGDLVQARVILEAQLDARKNITAEISKATQQTKAEMAAEQQHLAALNMTAGTLAQMGVKAAALRAELQNTDLSNLSKLSSVARQAVQLEQAIAQVNAKIKIMGSESHSLDQLSATLAETNRQYNALSQSDRRGAEGRRLLAEYKTITAELEREGKDLATIVNEEKQAAEAARQRAKMVADAAQKRKTEAAILATTAKNMKTLQEQERILSERLMTATFGSQKYRDLQTQLEAVRKKMKEVEGSVSRTNSAFTMQGRILQGLKSYAAMYLSVFGFARFIKQIRDVTGELEYQRVALGHLLRDVSFGNKLFDDIVEAAKKSPFRIKELVTYTKQLAAYQIEEDKLYDTTMRLADVSAGLGVDMNRLILAYGQVRAASVLRGQELRQFTEAGIPLVEKLAEKFQELGREGTTTADVFKLISQRAVPFEYVKQIFEEMTDAGGMFYHMQEEQAKTLKGRWEKLKDAYDQALMTIGNNETFQNWNDKILKILNGIASHLRQIVRIANAASVSWIMYSIATNKAVVSTVKFIASCIKEFGVMATLKLGVESLAASFRKLWAAMASNWIGLALSAVAGLITYFTTFKKEAKEVNEELSETKKAIEKLKNANKDLDYANDLIKTYEKLATTIDRTETQNKSLAKSMNELKLLYPELAEKIGDENTSLEEQVRLLKEAAAAKHEEAVEEAKNQLNIKRQVIRGLEEQEEEARLKKEAAEKALRDAEADEAAGVAVRYRPQSGRDDAVIYTTNAKDLEKFTVAAAEAAAKANDEYEKITEQLGQARYEANELEKIIDPKKQTEGWEQWAKEIKKIQENLQEVGEGVIFDDQELEGFHSIYELSGKLKKKIDDLKTSLTGMKSLLASMTDKDSDAYKNLSDEIKSNEKLMEMAEAIRIALGLTFGKSKSGGSDSRLSNLKNEISEATNAYKKYLELLKYMSEARAKEEIVKLFPQIKDVPDFDRTLNFLETKLKDVQAKIKKSPKDKVLLDMQRTLNTEISNLKFDKLKEKIDTELKNLSDEVKRSETARNFFNDILDLTGDTELSTTLTMQVYGQTGDEFKERVQKEMIGALESVKGITGDDFFNEMVGNVTLFDMAEIRRRVNEIPETVRPVFERLLDESEKFNADWFKDFYKTYQDAGDLQAKLGTIESRRTQKVNEAKAHGANESQIADINAAFDKEVAETRLEILKSTDDWIKAFEDLEGVGTHTLKSLLTLIREYRTQYAASLTPAQQKNLTQQEEKVEDELISRNPYGDTIKSMKTYFSALSKMHKLKKEGKEDSKEFKAAENDSRKALKNTKTAVNAVSDSFNNLSAIVNSVAEMIDFDEYSDGEAVFTGMAEALSLVGTALVFINAMLTIMETNPIVLAITGVIAGIAAIAKILSNLKVNQANRELKRQEEILDGLENAYERLDKAIDKAFGSDYIYNYNEQLKNLEAQIQAYNAQAAAERSKGKKADEDAIKGYEESARDAAEQIEEMRTQLSEFFTDSDITSAATDFAEAWLDAYKEFGSTTDAIREKFDDMIQSMVVKSLAAQVMKNILTPVMNAIDQYSQDGDFNASEIANISRMTKTSIEQINTAMTSLMTELGANGVNLRNTAGSFTGISRSFSGASEESINTLTAATNTQNFYMSYMPMISENVARILEVMGGDATRKTPAGANIGAVDYYAQMLVYAAYLPNMNDNLAELLHVFSSVITPKAASTNTHCVAIK